MYKPIVFLFPGQGSQYPQMAKSLFLSDPYFSSKFKELDQFVQKYAEFSVIDVLYGSSSTFALNHLLHSNLAIYLVQVSLSHTLIEQGVLPDVVLGTSLGEFAASTVAGILAPEDAIKTLIYLARIVEETCALGSMLAVLDSPSMFKDPSHSRLFQNCTIAGVHYHSNFLLSMPKTELKRVVRGLQNLTISSYPLPIDYAFHSPHIEPIKQSFTTLLNTISLKRGHTDFISCSLNNLGEPVTIPDYWRTIREPILFAETINHLTNQAKSFRFIDIGPSQTLANFINMMIPNHSNITGLLTPSHRDTLKLNQTLSVYANKDSFLKR